MANPQTNNTKTADKSSSKSAPTAAPANASAPLAVVETGSADWEVTEDPEIQAYWSPEAGELHGVVTGVMKMRNKDDGHVRVVYLVKLTKPCKGKTPDAGKKDPYEEFPVGTLMGATERARMFSLRPKVADFANVEIRIKPIELVELDDGREMWRLEIATRGGVKRPARLKVPNPPMERRRREEAEPEPEETYFD